MPTSGRVRADEFSPVCEVFENYAVDCVRGQWRIYEAWSDYTQGTGHTIRRGKVVRRFDPDAGLLEGKPASFTTKADAVHYYERWILKTGAR